MKTLKAGGLITRTNESGEQEILLIYRGKQDDWAFPKGHTDPGETQIEAAMREIHEELGVTPALVKELSPMEYSNSAGEDVSLSMYLFTVPADTVFTKEFPEDDTAWCSFDQALSKLTYDNLKEYLLKVQDELR